ncbi:MAG: ABC transporter ATP-binding protein [Acidobacteriota bacterium]
MNAAATSAGDDLIRFQNVSKFYGEVLGVNRINLILEPGIVGLVGPNGSGKTTLMNLMTGLLRPSEGAIEILGVPSHGREHLFHLIGYCSQVDAFPRGMTGYDFIYGYLRVHGYDHTAAEALTWQALDRVSLRDAAHRRVGGYSKGMRQRVKLAQAIAHHPRVLVLDEPLNGLDPMARAEVSAVFQDIARRGCHVIISSHILHEVDMIADQVIFLSGGYVVAEGGVSGVRSEIDARPSQILVRCDQATRLASVLCEADPTLTGVRLHDDRGGLEVHTRDADGLYRRLNELVLDLDLAIDTVTVADADVRAVYGYLMEDGGDAP